MTGATGLPVREYKIEEYTTTVCPECFAERARRSDEPDVFKDGYLVSHDGSIWMRRFCREHGETESLYEEDADLWRARAGWSTPTLRMTPDRPDNFGPFPHAYRNGLPASHGQHTCILLLNVTQRCNYACPTCYASALGPGAASSPEERPSVAEILRTVDTMLAREGGKLGVVMLSGGEPTVRRDIGDILSALAERNITRVMLNTNGRRIARDDRLLEDLRRLRHRVEVYLQFDGESPETARRLRGEDVTVEKACALHRLNAAEVFTTLVTTVRRGVNEGSLGEIVRLGLETPRCAGVMFQPVFGTGRGPAIDPKDRATPTGILRRLGEQTGGLVSAEDFVPLPCSHRDCCDITYLLRTGDGTWKSLPALLGRDELKKWIHLAANTISYDTVSLPVKEMLKSGALQRVLSEQMRAGTPDMTRDISHMCACIPGVSQLLGGIWSSVAKRPDMMERVAERTFRITVKMFMDAHTFHGSRLRQCCVHAGTFEADPRRHSFCWRWLFADAFDVQNTEAAAVPNGVALDVPHGEVST